MPDGGVVNGWNAWGKHVLIELEKNNADHERILEKLSALETDVAQLKIKAGVWGGVAGGVTVLVGILLSLAGKLF